MGEYAEDIIDGLRCLWCGILFTAPHGYPVVCLDCSGEFSDGDLEELGVGRATIDEVDN